MNGIPLIRHNIRIKNILTQNQINENFEKSIMLVEKKRRSVKMITSVPCFFFFNHRPLNHLNIIRILLLFASIEAVKIILRSHPSFDLWFISLAHFIMIIVVIAAACERLARITYSRIIIHFRLDSRSSQINGKEMIWNRLEVRSNTQTDTQQDWMKKSNKCVGSIWVINVGAIEISFDTHTHIHMPDRSIARSLACMQINDILPNHI